jgi:hypothetical protein
MDNLIFEIKIELNKIERIEGGLMLSLNTFFEYNKILMKD